jgi:peptidoglycan/LPS O-acetylase OafA/YrhL
MDLKDMTSEQIVTGWLLISSGILFLPAGMLFTGRAIWKWSIAQSQVYLFWERGLVMAAYLAAALGLVLLERLLEAVGDGILSPIGLAIILIATVLVIAAESFSLSWQKFAYAPIVVFIVLFFVGQAVFGASILRTGFLPGWVGWTTILWSLAWLSILPIARPKNMYYPWLHFVTPVMIGIMLLVR